MKELDFDFKFENEEIEEEVAEKNVDKVDTQALLYKQVGDSSIELSKEQQKVIGEDIVAYRRTFQMMMLYSKTIRSKIYNEFSSRLASGTGRVAKMGEDYNSSLKGHNDNIKERLIFNVIKAYEAENADEKAYLSYIQPLIDAKLHPRFFFNIDYSVVFEELYPFFKEAPREYLDKIEGLRMTLVNSVIKALASISAKYASRLNGDVVEAADIQQEAMLLAYQYTLLYDPTQETKWSSFCYSMVNKGLQKVVTDTTRTVAIPRSLIDRRRFVEEARSTVGSGNIPLITAMANKIIVEKNGGKISKEKVFTEKEVDRIVRSDFGSIAVSINSSNTGNDKTIIDFIASSNLSPEDEVVGASINGDLLDSLRKVLDNNELRAVILRYGLDEGEPRSINGIMENWKNFSLSDDFGLPAASDGVNKVKINNYLDSAIKKMRVNLKEFSPIWESFKAIERGV